MGKLGSITIKLTRRGRPLSLVLSTGPSGAKTSAARKHRVSLGGVPSYVYRSDHVDYVFNRTRRRGVSAVRVYGEGRAPIKFLKTIVKTVTGTGIRRSVT